MLSIYLSFSYIICRIILLNRKSVWSIILYVVCYTEIRIFYTDVLIIRTLSVYAKRKIEKKFEGEVCTKEVTKVGENTLTFCFWIFCFYTSHIFVPFWYWRVGATHTVQVCTEFVFCWQPWLRCLLLFFQNRTSIFCNEGITGSLLQF